MSHFPLSADEWGALHAKLQYGSRRERIEAVWKIKRHMLTSPDILAQLRSLVDGADNQVQKAALDALHELVPRDPLVGDRIRDRLALISDPTELRDSLEVLQRDFAQRPDVILSVVQRFLSHRDEELRGHVATIVANTDATPDAKARLLPSLRTGPKTLA